MKIWIDNDACPKIIKEVILKASRRLEVEVVLVANRDMAAPKSNLISMVKVPQGADIADAYIVDQMEPHHIVITADIPLADAVVTKGGVAINPRGHLYTEANIKERLSMRDFMEDLRSGGMVHGGPSAFSLKDKERFANTLDRTLTKALRKFSKD